MGKLKNRRDVRMVGLVFLFMLVWYVSIHPFVVFNGDDWTFIAKRRVAIPLPSAWNPTRLLPENLMPLCGSIAAYVVYPLTRDYIGSLTLVFGLAAALTVTLYVALFYCLLRRKLQVGQTTGWLVSVLFLGMHFLILRSRQANNLYLLGGGTPTTLFFYCVPTMLNGCLVMYLEAFAGEPRSRESGHFARRGLLIVAAYFVICSNMFCSVIVAAYAGMRLLMYAARRLRRRERLFGGEAVRACAGWALLALGWLLTIGIEFLGGRSHDLRGEGRRFALSRSAANFAATLSRLWKPLLLLSVVVMLLCIALLRKRRRGAQAAADAALRDALTWALPAGCAVTVYTVLLAAVAAPGYLLEAKLWQVILFFFILAVCACVAWLLDRYPRTLLVFPLCLTVLLSCIITPQMTFPDGTHKGLKAADCRAVDRYIVDSILEADGNGLTEVTVEVPVGSARSENWPVSTWAADNVSRALYLHRLTTRRIKVTFKPSPTVNERFFLDERL